MLTEPGKGLNMKLKRKIAPLSAKSQGKTTSEDDRRRVSRRQIWIRIAAVLLAVCRRDLLEPPYIG